MSDTAPALIPDLSLQQTPADTATGKKPYVKRASIFAHTTDLREICARALTHIGYTTVQKAPLANPDNKWALKILEAAKRPGRLYVFEYNPGPDAGFDRATAEFAKAAATEKVCPVIIVADPLVTGTARELVGGSTQHVTFVDRQKLLQGNADAFRECAMNVRIPRAKKASTAITPTARGPKEPTA